MPMSGEYQGGYGVATGPNGQGLGVNHMAGVQGVGGVNGQVITPKYSVLYLIRQLSILLLGMLSFISIYWSPGGLVGRSILACFKEKTERLFKGKNESLNTCLCPWLPIRIFLLTR